MTPNPRHVPKAWLNFPERTFCSAVTEDRRLRRTAAKLGLAIKKLRGVGGWLVIDRAEGPLAEPLFTWQAAELLHVLTRPESIHDWHKSAAIGRVRRRIAKEASA